MRDLQSELKVAQSIAPASRTATVNGSSVDVQGFDSLMMAFEPGAITDGTHTPKLQESDDNAAFSDVDAADQLGALADLASNVVQKVGYRGNKRYVRAVVTVSGATSGGVYGAHAVQGHAHAKPVA